MKRAATAIAVLLFACAGALNAQWDKDVFSWRGRNALQEGKYALAIENFNILTRLDSTDYWSFFWRGIAKYNLGDLRGARQDFNSSVRINPVFTNGYHYRAITWSRSGEYDKALEDLKTAINLRPGFNGLYYSRGVTYFLARRFNDAVADFNRYIHKEPSDASAFLNRGACQLFLGDSLKALADYNKAVALDRFEPESYIRRGALYAMLHDEDQALDDLNKALDLDSTSTLALFNRAILFYGRKDYMAAMKDLDKILEEEPGNALTLYNRSLIYAQVGDIDRALADMDRVLTINPGNVLAHFNRAAFYIEKGSYRAAIEDYDTAIRLYPDFAKAYLNRSYVKNLLGMRRESREDYNTAQRKVQEYRSRNNGDAALADTSAKFNSLLALDADFAHKDFNNELLQHRVVDINLKPLYRVSFTKDKAYGNSMLEGRYENPLLDLFIATSPVALAVSTSDSSAETIFYTKENTARAYFLKGLAEIQKKQFNKALANFNEAIRLAPNDSEADKYSRYYKALYLMNRAALKAEMTDFIASMEKNVQTITLDDKGNTRANLGDATTHSYDYSEAIADIEEALEILPDLPYLHYNLANLQCLSSKLVEAVSNYGQAISLYPGMGDAFYNRGLVLIFLKDKEKGCIDLSRAGELGVAEAYSVISKYCKEDEKN
ncbi:MAG: tetratricopeptide repeat protein [Bacteroidales bacterium]|nr:tetratricopeptide repeat protein [Bacteroidales bacterium]